MKKIIFLICYFLTLSSLGYFIGDRIYVLNSVDSEVALAYVFYYAIFLIIYLILTVWILIRTIRSNDGEKLFLYTLLLTWIPMIGFPAYKISLSQQEGQFRQIEFKKEEQIKYLKKLSSINEQISNYPDSSDLYLRRARVYRSNGFYNKAIIEAKKSIELNQTSSGLWELGWNYEISNDFKNAKTTYLIAKKYFPYEEWVGGRLEVINRKLKQNK